MKSIDTHADDFAEAWRPTTPGDTLDGTVETITAREAGQGPYPVLTLRRADGTRAAFHAFRKVAQGELGRVRPRVGERIAIRFGGEKVSAAGNRYYAYHVAAVDRPEPAFDWDSYRVVAPPSPGSDVSPDVSDYGRSTQLEIDGVPVNDGPPLNVPDDDIPW